ncbi:TniB family NTP-binding protein [Sphingomonas aerolata]|uniref:TniB family NTP-binding protein n=1 Tax=Sphingomonas aerolata TaxID=185951 RepID=UPI0035A65B67
MTKIVAVPVCSPDEPDRGRIAAIKRRYLIQYPRFTSLIDELVNVIEAGDPGSRYRAVFSSSYDGKSSLARELLRRYPIDMNPLGDAAEAPVVYTSLPGIASVHEFSTRILDALGESYNRRSSKASVLSSAFACLKAMKTRALIIDEFQHLHTGHWRERAGLTNTIKEIGEACGLSVFVFGVPSGIELIEREPQLSRRFEHLSLPRWSYDEDMLRLLMTMEERLPIRQRSNIALNDELIVQILDRTDGVFGHIRDLVESCAITAITTGREIIDLTTLDQSPWVPPAHRRDRTLTDIDARPDELVPPRAA